MAKGTHLDRVKESKAEEGFRLTRLFGAIPQGDAGCSCYATAR